MRKIRAAAVGVTAAALLAGVAPAQAAQSGANGDRVTAVSTQSAQSAQDVAVQGSSKYKVLKQFDYSRSKQHQLPLRLGQYYRKSNGKMVGWGWTKIKKKHNITKYGIIGWLAKSPNVDPVRGHRYNLTGWAHRVKCGPGGCKVVDRRKMLLATDETMTAAWRPPIRVLRRGDSLLQGQRQVPDLGQHQVQAQDVHRAPEHGGAEHVGKRRADRLHLQAAGREEGPPGPRLLITSATH